MTLRHVGVLAVLLLTAACTSEGSDAESGDVAPATSAPETASTDTASVDTDSIDTVSPDPAATDSVTSDPVSSDTAPAGSTGAPTTSDDVEPTDGGLVIDGPAQVRESCSSLTRGVNEFTLDAGGAVHDVRIYVPETVSSDPVPTVLDWHGLGSNGPEQAAYTGYEELAEQEGFVVVHPTGNAVVDGGPSSWELAQFDSPDRDDLAFADALIDTVVEDWCADPLRIYSTGMSNGGFFTSELVCNRSERIAAAVSVAGTSHPPSCDPARAVPYQAFHGTADDVVPYDGSGESSLSDTIDADGFFGQVMPDEFGEFATGASCDPEPERTEVTVQVVRFDYTGCVDGVPMSFFELPGAGHTWPNSPLAEALSGAEFGVFATDVDATVDGWEFMSQFSL